LPKPTSISGRSEDFIRTEQLGNAFNTSASVRSAEAAVVKNVEATRNTLAASHEARPIIRIFEPDLLQFKPVVLADLLVSLVVVAALDCSIASSASSSSWAAVLL
jgi:hypothetical protein